MLKEKLCLDNFSPKLKNSGTGATVGAIYNYWRIRTFYSIYIGYLFYYFTRKSFIFTIPFLSPELALSKADIGLLGSILTITYGISKFINGIFSDRYNPRYLISIGLICSGICNIFFGFSTSLLFLGIFWGLNGWFQGYGWPGITKQLMYWYSNSERAKWWCILTTSITIGGFLIAYIAGGAANFYGWQAGVIIPGIMCIMVGFWLLNRLRGTPETLGLPTIEHFKEEPVKENEPAHNLGTKEILRSTLCNKQLWLIALSSFFIYAIRTAICDWGTLYLLEEKGYEPIIATSAIAWFEIGCFVGFLVSGFASDKWFSGKRLPLIVMSSVFLFFVLIALRYLVADFILTTFIIVICGLLVSIPQMLLEIASTELASKRVASSANGFAGWFAYCGAAAAGYPLGKLTDVYGWNGFVIVVGCFVLLHLCVSLPILFSERKTVIDSAFSLQS